MSLNTLNTLNNMTTVSNSPNTELNLSTSENINSIDLLREKLKKINWEYNELKVLKESINILNQDDVKGNETSVVLVVERVYNLINKQNMLLHVSKKIYFLKFFVKKFKYFFPIYFLTRNSIITLQHLSPNLILKKF
jgi:hypothetical protein